MPPVMDASTYLSNVRACVACCRLISLKRRATDLHVVHQHHALHTKSDVYSHIIATLRILRARISWRMSRLDMRADFRDFREERGRHISQCAARHAAIVAQTPPFPPPFPMRECE